MTDPQATWVPRPGVDPFFAYDANYLIDNKAGIILDAEGTRANRTVEIAVTQTMMERVRCRFGLLPQRLAGDTVYGAVRLLKWLVDCQIAPHIPVWDKSVGSDCTFSRADFVFDRSRNIHRPEWKIAAHDRNGHRRQYASLSCLKARLRCLRVQNAVLPPHAFEQSRRERKKVEMRFAHMKRIFRLDRLRLRGLSGAVPTAQNLRRLVKLLGRAPPPFAVACPA